MIVCNISLQKSLKNILKMPKRMERRRIESNYKLMMQVSKKFQDQSFSKSNEETVHPLMNLTTASNCHI